jgi:hypothetical protein
MGLPLYPVGPDAPATARVRSPWEIAEWFLTTHDARDILEKPWIADLRSRDRRAYRNMVVLLADELHRRERGKFAPSEEALVGTYLKRLPDDGSAELGDDTTPTVSD